MKKPRNRVSAHARPTPGAFGKHKRTVARKKAFIADSQQQGIRIANDRALKKAYHDFYLTPAGRKFAKEFGKSSVDSAPRRTNRAPTVDFHDPADLPDSVGCGSHNGRKIVRAGHHPVDDMEPEAPSIQIEGLSDDEIHGSSEMFGLALRWALDADEIVSRGRRSIVMISEMRPDLGRGFKSDRNGILQSFKITVRGSRIAIEKCGDVFARYLEWMRRAGTVAGIGERLDLTAYVLRPDLLTANTLAKLGALVGKTRQAKDKLANCQRDTFSGIKALPMRADITRDRCRASQLAHGT
jgi:hypothetical protein